MLMSGLKICKKIGLLTWEYEYYYQSIWAYTSTNNLTKSSCAISDITANSAKLYVCISSYKENLGRKYLKTKHNLSKFI